MSLSASLSRESQLLLACVKLAPAREDLQRIERELGDPALDWSRLVDRAYQQDVGPLMYNTMRQIQAPAAGFRPAMDRLRAAYCANGARNTVLFRELGKILRTFHEHGNPVIALKGAALAETVYPNRALRPMSDLDLLVRKEALGEVEELLAALGYAVDEKQRGMKEWYYANFHHLVFQREVAPSLVLSCEIHWHLERPTRPFPIDIDGVWQRAVAATIAGAPALVLCPEDLLLYLCLHTCKHRLTGGFRAFCDISETVRYFAGNMDWNQVLARASQWRIKTFVYVPLRLAQELLGAQTPEWVMNALLPEGFDNRLLCAACAEGLEDRLSASLFPDFYEMRYGSSFKNRTKALRKMFSRAAIAERYGISPASKKVYGYYPKRIKDLVVDYGPELWRFVRRGDGAISEAEGHSRLAEWLAPFDSTPPP